MFKRILVGLVIVGFVFAFAVGAMADMSTILEWEVEAEVLTATVTANMEKKGVNLGIEWTDDLFVDGIGTITPSLSVDPFTLSAGYNIDSQEWNPEINFNKTLGLLTFDTTYNFNSQEFATIITLEI